jgi:Skp family chaperone for outer membrane proteins
MGFTDVVNLVNHVELTAKQRSDLQKILKARERDLKKALADVEAAMKKLKPKGK